MLTPGDRNGENQTHSNERDDFTSFSAPKRSTPVGLREIYKHEFAPHEIKIPLSGHEQLHALLQAAGVPLSTLTTWQLYQAATLGKEIPPSALTEDPGIQVHEIQQASIGGKGKNAKKIIAIDCRELRAQCDVPISFEIQTNPYAHHRRAKPSFEQSLVNASNYLRITLHEDSPEQWSLIDQIAACVGEPPVAENLLSYDFRRSREDGTWVYSFSGKKGAVFTASRPADFPAPSIIQLLHNYRTHEAILGLSPEMTLEERMRYVSDAASRAFGREIVWSRRLPGEFDRGCLFSSMVDEWADAIGDPDGVEDDHLLLCPVGDILLFVSCHATEESVIAELSQLELARSHVVDRRLDRASFNVQCLEFQIASIPELARLLEQNQFCSNRLTHQICDFLSLGALKVAVPPGSSRRIGRGNRLEFHSKLSERGEDFIVDAEALVTKHPGRKDELILRMKWNPDSRVFCGAVHASGNTHSLSWETVNKIAAIFNNPNFDHDLSHLRQFQGCYLSRWLDPRGILAHLVPSDEKSVA